MIIRALRAGARRAVHLVDVAVFPPSREGGNDQWARAVMNTEVAQRLRAIPPQDADALEVSGRFHKSYPWKSYTYINWPAYDICDPGLDLGREFDVILLEQILEHVENPWKAVENVRRLLRPGGLAVITTPFLLRKHENPKDFWRFTEDGTRVLLESAGLEVETVNSWGNRQCVVGNFNRWARPRSWHSMRNEPNFPVVVWSFSQRPLSEPEH